MLANSSTLLEQKFHRHFLSNSAASQSLASNSMLAVFLEDEILDFPRHLSIHPGGFLLGHEPVHDLVPIENATMPERTVIQWDKLDVEDLGLFKVDLLGLGGLTQLDLCFKLLRQHRGLELSMATIPADDKPTFDMICKSDTIGVFQIESRAQMAMLPRLKPRNFYDLVIEISIVRPGPITGGMVHPYLRRRQKKEPIDYPHPTLEPVLKKTLGVPLFQEQVMRLAMIAADYTPGEADQLRRDMAAWHRTGRMERHRERLIARMQAKGIAVEFAERVFEQIRGFGEYGFPESHAAAFAHLVYISSWLKCHYPDVFAAALLNSQPMGFYQPAQIVIDARNHGVVVRPVDVNFSVWDNTLEEKDEGYSAVRLGFRQVKGLNENEMQLLVDARGAGYTSISQLSDAGVSQPAIEKLADADAFRSLQLDRREALWEVPALSDKPVGIFEGSPSESAFEAQISLPFMTQAEHVVHDYATTGLSLKAHPVSFVREKLDMLRVLETGKLPQLKNGDPVKVAGLVTVRQRPGTAMPQNDIAVNSG